MTLTTTSPPSPPLLLLLLVVFTILASPSSIQSTSSSVSSLSRRSSLSVDDTLVSPDRSFTFGFHQVGTNAYALSIWFSSSTNRTVAWTANRDRPVNARASALTFQKDGAVALTDFDGTVVWKTNTTSTPAQTLRLLDTGNLVVTGGPDDGILWQSFDYPTDTLLPTQPITKNIKLVSSIAPGSLSSGYYSFYFDNDNVLRLIYDGPEISSIYWPNPDFDVWGNGRTKYNSSRYGVLDHLGRFAASDQFAFNASDAGPGITRRRLSIDYDGNLRLYSLSESEGTWAVSWVAIPHGCLVHGLCGKNGVCGYATTKRACSCLPGFRMSDPSDWSKGCKREIDIKCNDDDAPQSQQQQQIMFVEIPRMDFWGYDLNHSVPVSYKFCEDLCRHSCSCEAFEYKTGSGECYTKSVLFNGRSSPDSPGSIYLKLPKGAATVSKLSFSQAIAPICNESSLGGGGVSAASSTDAALSGGKRKWAYLYGFVSAFGAIEILFIASGWFFVFRKDNKPASLLEQGYKMISSQFRKYTYRELSKATNKFKDELGRGASGAVYKGILDDERAVAVKKMEDAIQGGEEFWAEVSVIGRIYHMNLVRMWGFCSEGSHKLLVYEYVERGSLEKLLFDNSSSSSSPQIQLGQFQLLGWRERFKIALGVARGLAYLHHECLEWVIHCDMKPENILLDKDFEPKIADFGLAKLLMRGGAGSELSKIRGTRGYMAPEWVSNQPITAKVDVYSYGVVVLEMVKGSRISTWMASGGVNLDTELVGLLKMLKTKPESRDGDSWVMDFVDSRLEGKFNTKQVAVMLEVAVSCLEEEMNKRPTMDDVLHRLLSCED